MNKLILVLLALFISTGTFAQGIEFEHGTFQEALVKAKKENKLVFMDCYTSWCGPCKYLAKTIFTQKEVGDYFNAKFVNVKMDMEKGEGIELHKKYEVKAFPTLLFIDVNGKEVHKIVGGVPAQDLINGAKAALDPNLRIEAFQEKYKNGNRDYDFLMSYLSVLKAQSDKIGIKIVSNELINNSGLEKFFTKDLFFVVVGAGFTFDSKEFKTILKEKKTLEATVNKDELNGLLAKAITDHLKAVANSCENLRDLENETNKCKEYITADWFDQFSNGLKGDYYLAKKQYQEWFDFKIAALGPKTESKYTYGLLELGDKIYYNPKLREQKEIVEQAFVLAKELAGKEQGLIIGNFMLSKMYVIKKEKEKAQVCFDLFYETNKKTRGELTHPSITGIRDAIKAL